MNTFEFVQQAVIVLLLTVILIGYLRSRKLNEQLRRAENECDYNKSMWQADYQRYLLFKARVIELNAELEHARDQEPIIKYVEDPQRVPR